MFFIIWLVLALIAGVIATNKERSFWGFFFLSIFLTPLVGILAALIAMPNEKRVIERDISSGLKQKCPYCKELIQPDAIVCRYCGKDIDFEENSTKYDADKPDIPINKLSKEEWSNFKSRMDGEKPSESFSEYIEIYNKHFGKDYNKVAFESKKDVVDTIIRQIDESIIE